MFLDLGSDLIFLGVEIYRGLYFIEIVRIVGRICFEVSRGVEGYLLLGIISSLFILVNEDIIDFRCFL